MPTLRPGYLAFVSIVLATLPTLGMTITLNPLPAQDSAIQVQLTYMGTMPASLAGSVRTNATSPVAVGSHLLLVDQTGFVYQRDVGGALTTVFTPTDAPAGLSLMGEKILNVVSNQAGNALYVAFTSATTPAGTPVSISPRGNASAYQVIYRYDFDGTSVSNPQPLRAFAVNPTGHTGGGMAVLDDGSLLFTTGDHGDAGEDGRSFAQDSVSHLSKIVQINPSTGDTTIVAKGVRNVQRLAMTQHEGKTYVDFVDIGGNVAEELNTVLLADLLDPTRVENFGWGRNSTDNLAREGTFYIDANGQAVSAAPLGEAGFLQPLAQWGREAQSFVAGTGSISCADAFRNIDTLFGDLPSGTVYAIQSRNAGLLADVRRVNLVDATLHATTLSALAGGRPDPRFFCFADGSAGVLLERTGDFYRLAEIASIPEPSSLLLCALPALLLLIQHSQHKRRGSAPVPCDADEPWSGLWGQAR